METKREAYDFMQRKGRWMLLGWLEAFLLAALPLALAERRYAMPFVIYSRMSFSKRAFNERKVVERFWKTPYGQ